MSKYEIIPATEKQVKFLDEQITAFNRSKVDEGQLITRKNYVIKNNQKVIAGITTVIYHLCLYVDVLFVDEQYRRAGIGGSLLQKAEQVARENGITLIHLDTFDFQAKDFYLKHGFQVFGILEDCPTAGHKRYYMKKKI